MKALSQRLTKRDLEIIPACSGDKALKMLAERSTIEVQLVLMVSETQNDTRRL